MMKRSVIAELLRSGRPDLANVLAYRVTAAKELFYHGTTTKLAKRILSEGFVPNPKVKTWDQEQNRLASYHGTYFAPEVPKASSSAQTAAIKFGGRPAVFEVQLETRAALMDEDDLPKMFDIFTAAAGRHYILDSLRNKALDKYSSERGKQENAQFLAGEQVKPIVAKVVEMWLDRFSSWKMDGKMPGKLRKHLHDAVEKMAWANLRAAAEGVHLAHDEDNAELRAARNDLMRRIGSIAKLKGGFIGNNARIVEPVTFRGANRILAAVVEPQDQDPVVQQYKDLPFKDRPYPVYVIFGTPSSKFVGGMKQHWSSKLKLVKSSMSRIPNVFAPYHEHLEPKVKLAASRQIEDVA